MSAITLQDTLEYVKKNSKLFLSRCAQALSTQHLPDGRRVETVSEPLTVESGE